MSLVTVLWTTVRHLRSRWAETLVIGKPETVARTRVARQVNSDSGNSLSSIPPICLRSCGTSSIAAFHRICQSRSK
jgi:hypothetical protein